MSRLPLLILAVAPLTLPSLAAAREPFSGHFDPLKLTADCTPCHFGHGARGTPMLEAAGDEACLACHDAQAATPQGKAARWMAPGADPADIRSLLGKSVAHPGAGCRDCHSVHGVDRLTAAAATPGLQKSSPRRGFASEAELCLSCHGGAGLAGDDPDDLSRLLDPSNSSFHPILAPARRAEVPSLREPLAAGAMVNCTDCHGNDDPAGPRGPHASSVSGLLSGSFSGLEGQPESAESYALCYRCHDREIVLDEDQFPLHREHVVGQGASCSTCHDPHGVTSSRALIGFGELEPPLAVSPSSSGRLDYVSQGAGSGTCYLSCHGKDHDPLGYGAGLDEVGAPLLEPLDQAIRVTPPSGPRPPVAGSTRGADPRRPKIRRRPDRPD